MTIRILIVDPDIQFTARLKPAIEAAGDFAVRVCATGSAALDTLQHEPHDVAVLDFEVSGMPDLVEWLRGVQPGLYMLATPRNQQQAAQIAALGVQGSVTKPYFARQIVPVIIEAAAARTSFEQLKPKQSPAIDLPVVPDDTFLRLSQQADTTSKRASTPPEVTSESGGLADSGDDLYGETLMPSDATIGDLVSGQPVAPSSVPEMPAASEDDQARVLLLEPIPDEGPSVALTALKVTTDTTPLEQVSVQAVVDQVNLEALETGFTQPGALAQELPTWAEADEPEPLNTHAERAAQLTQLTVDLSARATLLTRGDLLVASAGSLAPDVIADALIVIGALWQKEAALSSDSERSDPSAGAAEERKQSIIRYISVDTSDFLLFSIPTVAEMTLSMLFSPETAIHVMRRQAKQLVSALETVPEVEVEAAPAVAENAESAIAEEAAAVDQTETDAAELEQVVRETQETPQAVSAVDSTPAAEPAAPAAEPAAAVQWTSCGFVWRPRRNELPLHIHSLLAEWLLRIARMHGWKLVLMDARMDCVNLEISLPQDVMPMTVVETLMRETAAEAGDDRLWAEGYYIIPDSRLATAQEIAEFVEFQREIQQAV